MKYSIPLLAFLLLACAQQAITPVEYNTTEYLFLADVANQAKQNNDMGFLSTRLSFVSGHQQLLQLQGDKDADIAPLSDTEWNELLSVYRFSDARKYILEQSKSHEILMINENHFLPEHRHFATSLLADLYANGYRYLALEALSMAGEGVAYDTEINTRPYPKKLSGFYAKEPEMGNLIREANKLGFVILGYDEGSAYGYSGGERESRGAANITKQLKDLGQDGKLLVFCGWNHIKEGEAGSYWGYALAERLREVTGHDPFTVNQSQYSEMAQRNAEDSLMQRIDILTPAVLIDSDKKSINLLPQDWYDVFVFHPRSVFTHGIPQWLASSDDIVPVTLPEMEIECPCQVFIHETEDNPSEASPLFVKEINDAKDEFYIPSAFDNLPLVITNQKESYKVN